MSETKWKSYDKEIVQLSNYRSDIKRFFTPFLSFFLMIHSDHFKNTFLRGHSTQNIGEKCHTNNASSNAGNTNIKKKILHSIFSFLFYDTFRSL